MIITLISRHSCANENDEEGGGVEEGGEDECGYFLFLLAEYDKG
jgi:hypothetical protein